MLCPEIRVWQQLLACDWCKCLRVRQIPRVCGLSLTQLADHNTMQQCCQLCRQQWQAYHGKCTQHE